MAELHVVDSGPGQGPVVVWLGSLGSTTAMWDPQRSTFEGRARNVLLDLPGHGGSRPPTGPLTIESLADGVVGELDRLGIGRAHVVGLSIGGAMGMAIALRHPDRIDRLALLCTSADFGAPDDWLDRAALVRAEGLASIAPVIVGRWLTPGYADGHPDDVATLEAMVSGADAEGYAACCEAIAAVDLRPELPLVTAPTVVVAGALDPATPVEHGELIAAMIPGAAVEIVEAAHLASWEQPARINQLLAHHLLLPGR
ncbi:MAG: alpha/beta fold hydrolase [Ilumatobacteraceae bacterium]